GPPARGSAPLCPPPAQSGSSARAFSPPDHVEPGARRSAQMLPRHSGDATFLRQWPSGAAGYAPNAATHTTSQSVSRGSAPTSPWLGPHLVCDPLDRTSAEPQMLRHLRDARPLCQVVGNPLRLLRVGVVTTTTRAARDRGRRDLVRYQLVRIAPDEVVGRQDRERREGNLRLRQDHRALLHALSQA